MRGWGWEGEGKGQKAKVRKTNGQDMTNSERKKTHLDSGNDTSGLSPESTAAFSQVQAESRTESTTLFSLL